ncbi:hypothetical protein EIY72_11610 [Pseudomonas vancouverensis]|uniref:Uncharacterized protein n=1 Tax=Pseudomonas vancouverensis TaxID=95300 RepID=A0A4R4K919_PSEVA|nr:hypothetical protein F7R09_26395 [Pseudomonas vancouverensis]TDB64264.1 hypothetical protein EIY72_11610 [Pseudomonas vancouverensis]
MGPNIHRKKMWERACSRWRHVSQQRGWLHNRYREQARSHRVLRCSGLPYFSTSIRYTPSSTSIPWVSWVKPGKDRSNASSAFR